MASSKLCLVLLLAATSLALLLVTTDASILRTSTVTEIDEENPSKGSCSQQLRGMSLTPCMNWMKYSSGSGAELEEAEAKWAMARKGRSSSEQYKKQCCNMMKQIEDEECMCSALKKTVREKCMSSGQAGRPEICGERMTEKLMSVPMMCGLMNDKCQYRMLVI